MRSTKYPLYFEIPSWGITDITNIGGSLVRHTPWRWPLASCGSLADACGLRRFFTTGSSAFYQRVRLQTTSNDGRKMRKKTKKKCIKSYDT